MRTTTITTYKANAQGKIFCPFTEFVCQVSGGFVHFHAAVVGKFGHDQSVVSLRIRQARNLERERKTDVRTYSLERGDVGKSLQGQHIPAM